MATLLLKKSYLLKNLKETKFNDLWDSYGIFTTMRVIGKKKKILFLKQHINNLIKSIKIYKLNRKHLKKKIFTIINKSLAPKKNYDHLIRIALNKKLISISLRKRIQITSKFKLKLLNYKRIDPTHKNLKYKVILSFFKKFNNRYYDVALLKNNKFLETGTSNLLFIQNNKIYSPKKDFYAGITFKFFRKKIKIIFKDIIINEINLYDEIILVGSGKGVTSVSEIEKIGWKRKSFKYYKKLISIYKNEIKKL